ncbi:conserved hypothetical protein [Ricinus communis]|uniref:Uncharacterized protein n=1 Tax=Ricinus communis TaxID=3988 RepID=B9R8C0_RICCO|nr:conserved hypothetical protein [Ricinus communis]
MDAGYLTRASTTHPLLHAAVHSIAAAIHVVGAAVQTTTAAVHAAAVFKPPLLASFSTAAPSQVRKATKKR